ncbi:short-chain fatty acid transporter [Salinisphaera orenii MK-B5]|uniref:Short-chain fatty acid transporter n=1 Tax=Salinisphaera orenii MK-B5 TaxID=856730 RepID=A0A423PFS5_9GAMM|nr:TIGR00366 family protein [Salinisphaera orenii]ROO24425.1 short-chain fatty acid transporter [Salinisphaera orenii MK-B5]
MFSALTRGCVRVFDRYLPDPLILVLIITLVVFAAGMVFQGHGPVAMLGFWQDGFWNLLSFAMQMALMLVTGFTVAKTPLFMSLVSRIATVARTPVRAVVTVSFVSLVVTWFNWGIGLVVGAILARELARRVEGVDYRLLVASAYAGFIIWHAGLSAAAPLVVATPGHFLEDQIGLISTSETIFSPINLIICLVILVLMPIVCGLMMRGIKDPVTVKADQLEDAPAAKRDHDEQTRPAERLEQSKWLAWISAALGFAAVLAYAFTGGGLNLNIVIFVLIFLGLALHGSAKAFLETLDEAVRGVAGVLIQFPFYAGIMGMMSASGLAAELANGFVSISTAHTLPFISFLSAGFINIFIPSGGGQWAVQGPILIEAAQSLNADIGNVITGFAWGDAWTNMIQPFWALPALAIAGLKARDIMGFCVVIMLVTGVAIGALLLI